MFAWTWDGKDVHAHAVQPPEDWKTVLADLGTQGIWRLPPQGGVASMCTPENIALIIEAKAGGNYLNNEFDSIDPMSNEGDPGLEVIRDILKRVRAIADIVQTLVQRSNLVAERVDLPRRGCGCAVRVAPRRGVYRRDCRYGMVRPCSCPVSK